MSERKVKLSVKKISPKENHHSIQEILSKFLLIIKDESCLKAANYLFSVTFSIIVFDFMIYTLPYSLLSIILYIYFSGMASYDIVSNFSTLNYYLVGISLFFILLETIIDKEESIIFSTINENNDEHKEAMLRIEKHEGDETEIILNSTIDFLSMLLAIVYVLFVIYCFFYISRWLVVNIYLGNLYTDLYKNWNMILINFTFMGIITSIIIRMVRIKISNMKGDN